MPRKLVFSLIFLLMVGSAFGQNVADPKKDEEKEKLRKNAVSFLRETMVEVGAMRSLENRLSFGAELASLMWFHDEKEARVMYQGVTDDFRKLLMEFDTQLNNAALAEANKSDDDDNFEAPGLFTGLTSKMTVERKLMKALEMRQQIAMSLAEHEPDMALAFFYDSLSTITNKEFREKADDRDSTFEVQLMTQVAETNAAKASQFAAKAIEKGFGYQHLELLKKIYAKDADKGIEFASAVVGHYKSNKLEGSDMWVLHSLIEFGESTAVKLPKADAKKPVLTTSELRDLTEVLAQEVLANAGDGEGESGLGYMATFEKYTPTRAAQIKAKYRSKIAGGVGNYRVMSGDTSIATANAANAAANAMAYASNVAAVTPDADRRAKAVEERLEAERKLMEEVATLGTKKLPKEEREKIVTQARKVIGRSGGKDKKILGLSTLALQVSKAGDKELAAEIMKEAETFVNLQPKNYQDYVLNWMLISGYSEVDADKAFPMLTDTILRLNGTIEAFVKAAEFIDVQEEIIGDGEVQVGQFGGSMLRGMTSELKIAEPTLRSLAKADFARTRAAANSFDRTEVRVLAKMLVIRAILGDNKSETRTDQANIVLDGVDINDKPR